MAPPGPGLTTVPFPSSPGTKQPSHHTSNTGDTLYHAAVSSSASLDSARSLSSSKRQGPTRTIAILTKSCAKVHRLSIEARLTSAGFDILLSRTEEWSYPDDVDFLHEFLQGHSASAVDKWIERLSNQSIYLMVLERNNAVQTWLDLMGSDGDEEKNEQEQGEEEEDDVSFNSFRSSGSGGSGGSLGGAKLRTIYGKHVLYGSISQHQADRQIAICAPELASQEAIAELELSMTASADAEDESVIQHDEDGIILTEDGLVYNEQGEAFDANTGAQVELQEQLVPVTHRTKVLLPGASTSSSSPRKQTSSTTSRDKDKASSISISSTPTATATFKARAVPASLATPKIPPRLSRAAALRMGVELPTVPKRQVATSTSNASDAQVGISGLPKTAVAKPKSLAEPAVKPRGNRASLARIGGQQGGAAASATGGRGGGGGAMSPTEPKVKKEIDFSDTPGHRNKRSSLSAVTLASLKPPSIAPRTNKAAMARLGSGGVVTTNAAQQNRAAALDALSGGGAKSPTMMIQGQAVRPQMHHRARSSVSFSSTSASASDGRTSPVKHAISTKQPQPQNAMMDPTSPRVRKPVDFSNTPGHKRTSMSGATPVASLAAPKIAPRTNLAAQRRLSHGGVGAGAGAGATTAGQKKVQRPSTSSGAGSSVNAQLQARSSSSLAFNSKTPTTATAGMGMGGVHGKPMSARPSSSAGIRQAHGPPHQDGAENTRPRRVGGNGTAPPSSFRLPTTAA